LIENTPDKSGGKITGTELKGTGMGIRSLSGNGDASGKHNPSPAGYQGGTKMNLSMQATDNIAEVLLKILEFTQSRQKILIQNINTMHMAGFVPRDLPVDEFAGLMFLALSEHASSRRLLLCDGENVKFGAGGSFEMKTIVDEQAKLQLKENMDEYLRDQISKLLENSLNQRIATELLRQKQADGLCPVRRMN
jgi:hypothetical protein